MTVALSSVIIAAALTLLLFGARVQRMSNDEAGEQQTVRIVLSALENIAGSGKIHSVETTENGWDLMGQSGTTLLQYENGALRNGENVLLDGLQTAYAELDGSLLTFQMETRQHSYRTAVFCRTGMTPVADSSSEALETAGKKEEVLPEESELTTDEKDARFAFLQTLTSQYGSTGKILPKDEAGTTFAQWYNEGWSEDTPWCACFLSWALEENRENLKVVPKFAHVDKGVEYFQDSKKPGEWLAGGSTPTPGDVIFFDWEGKENPKPEDADHVGAVLYVKKNSNSNDLVYTIEGNSGGKVAVHSYRLSDSRIMGYGVLDWKP